MTAINIVTTRNHVHIASDSAIYSADGVVHQFADKIRPVHRWPGAVAGRGSALAVALIGQELAVTCQTFDDAVEAVSDNLRGIVDRLGLADLSVELFLTGCSAERERAESYVVLTSDALPMNCDPEQARAAVEVGYRPSRPFELLSLPPIVMGPTPSNSTVADAFYQGFDLDSEPAEIVLELRRVLQMQRHETYGGVHWCGGSSQAVTVSASGVVEQRLQTWPDIAGERLRSLPIDWMEWCEANGVKPTAEQIEVRDQVRAIEKILAEADLQSV